ncbi:hypothetical protein [Flavobacterium ardleyense]|uniref:hypothetical protein n=1 Tax=Flavobacterium ardleyense TaxID=2038737 RepID=UPI00298CDCF9|nr:hypothetical protein [Flavobacterium ardleyense]
MNTIYLQDGATHLLGETCQLLNEQKIEYLIVGGWSPYLLNQAKYPHPGTKDVDVLFKSGTEKGQLKEVIQSFINEGFIQSAKHPFQLLKTYKLNGHNFMFNVDLLHPDNQAEKPEKYVDHIDFPVKESKYMRIDYSGKTIILPQSDLFFDEFSFLHTQNIQFLDGSKNDVSFNLLDEAGLILSKTKSVYNAKRTRDAYDIFLAFYQGRNPEKTIQQLKSVSEKYPDVKTSLQKMYTEKNLELFNTNCYEWFSNLNVSEGEREIVVNEYEKFFKSIDLQILTEKDN